MLGVLVVDNHWAICELFRIVLSERGYSVWESMTPEAALELFTQHVHSIHLVLLNVNLPGLTGPELLDQMRAIRPQVRCVFMSAGDLGRYTREELLAAGAEGLLEKPFTTQRLLGAMKYPDRPSS